MASQPLCGTTLKRSPQWGSQLGPTRKEKMTEQSKTKAEQDRSDNYDYESRSEAVQSREVQSRGFRASPGPPLVLLFEGIKEGRRVWVEEGFIY